MTPQPFVVVAPEGVHWLGHADDEADAWRVALGWPDEQEIADRKAAGWYCVAATVTWRRPGEKYRPPQPKGNR